MKLKLYISVLKLTFLFSLIVVSSICNADYTTMNLPEGAIARFAKGKINDVKFSQDSKFIAIGSPTGIWFYDAQTHNEIALLTEGSDKVDSVAFSPNGKIIAGGGKDVRLWSITDKQVISVIANPMNGNRVTSLTFSPDAQMLAIYIYHKRNNKFTVKLFSIVEKRVIIEFTGNRDYEWISMHVFSPDGQTLLYSDGDDIKLLKIAEKRVITVLKGKAKGEVSAFFSSDGWMIAYEDNDVIRLWSVPKMRLITTFKKEIEDISSLTFSPNGQILACGGWNEIELWSVNKKNKITTLKSELQSKWLYSLIFSPDGQMIASGDGMGETVLWSITKKQEIAYLSYRDLLYYDIPGRRGSPVRSIVFSPDGQRLASIVDGDVLFKNIFDKSETTTIEGHSRDNVYSIAFSSNRQILACGGWAHTKLWSIAKKQQILKLEYVGNSLAFSPNGQILACGGWDQINLWSMTRNQEIASLDDVVVGFFNPVDSLVFSPNGQFLVSRKTPDNVDDKDFIKLWSIDKKQVIGTLRGYKKYSESGTISFLPNSRILAYDDGDDIKMWSIDKQQDINIIKDRAKGNTTVVNTSNGLILAYEDGDDISLWSVDKNLEIWRIKGHNGTVSTLVFSPDGQILASGGHEFVKLWSVDKKREIVTLKGYRDTISTLVFSPDSQMLVGEAAGVPLLWDLSHFIHNLE